ncbi:hypothetical protein Acsp01_55700 [Actinoplanes sp. NBRC 101535]|nr:hypothetical protein Acsp01_55700 [Actinoplanes sp. NBRC 101535]
MRLASETRRGLSVLTVVTFLALGPAGCGGDAPEAAPASAIPVTSTAPPSSDARSALAGLAALGLDRRYAALYRLDVGDGAPRDVVATVATDGSWRVDIPRGAQAGTADVSVVRTAAGVYVCSLPSVTNPVTSSCVRVAEKGEKVPRRYDPKVQRLFRQWLTVFTDRQSALAVTAVQPLEGAQGSCFSVDSVSASLDAPVDVGVYCYSADGLLTAARVEYGVLTLVSQVAGPATVQLPGVEVSGEPLGTTSPSPAPQPSYSLAPPA